jgi:hypothetical protein
MSARIDASTRRKLSCRCLLPVASLAAVALLVCAQSAFAQFSSGSNGKDGAYAPTVSGNFDPTDFHGPGVPNNVFNFTTITIPAGVTITFTASLDNQPIYFLATGKVEIDGTLNLNGANGANATNSTTEASMRVPALPGSGGYAGGVGGNSKQPATAGDGPGGTLPGYLSGGLTGDAVFTGDSYLNPLIGGSGGGGAPGSGCGGFSGFDAGGGAGGGAILIASSTQIVLNGSITANGGQGGQDGCADTENGSGGAIRLVSNTISGTGSLVASGGGYPEAPYAGLIRLEAYSDTFPPNGAFSTPYAESSPYGLSAPTVPQPSVRATSINGTPITENPFSFPDITINTANPVPVVITGVQVPVGTVANLIILGETADQDSLSCTLEGTVATSTCTIDITFYHGGSWGLVKAKW